MPAHGTATGRGFQRYSQELELVSSDSAISALYAGVTRTSTAPCGSTLSAVYTPVNVPRSVRSHKSLTTALTPAPRPSSIHVHETLAATVPRLSNSAATAFPVDRGRAQHSTPSGLAGDTRTPYTRRNKTGFLNAAQNRRRASHYLNTKRILAHSNHFRGQQKSQSCIVQAIDEIGRYQQRGSDDSPRRHLNALLR